MVARCSFVTCLVWVFLSAAEPVPRSRSVRYAPAYIEAEHDPNYAYEYGVDDPGTGDNKAQWEQRYGDVVKGSYSLAEPDGTVRVVNYAADGHNGFNAIVNRYGTAIHPGNLISKPIIVAPIANNALPEEDTINIPRRAAPTIHSTIPVVRTPVIISKQTPVVIIPVSPLPRAQLPPPPPQSPAPFTIKVQRKGKGTIFGPGKKRTFYIHIDPATLGSGPNYLQPTFTRKTRGKHSTGWVPVKGDGEKLSRQLQKALVEIEDASV